MTMNTVSSIMEDHIANKTTEEEEEELESEIDVKQSNDELLADTISDQHENTLPPKPIIAYDILPSSIVICPNPEDYPETYRSNSKKEELILIYIENFRRQYHHIYRNRKSLFLNPLNECGISKFVSTTIRPTMLPFSDLIEWNSVADFIADHLNYDLLEPPYELPKTFWSPTKILKDQHGNCFGYANLLCSLLLGAGYDAYVVSGYATREICYMDTTRLQNPYIRKPEEERIEQLKNHCKKYGVKPAKDFTSKYDAYMHRRYLDKIREDKNQIQNEENKRIAEIERPLSDPLYGIRIHAWVLILSGKRDISKEFYIEPTTGYAKMTNDIEYLGIESIWNHQNLWVNMQDCSNGCQSLQFDLNDQARWECTFTSSTNLHEIDKDIIEEEEKIRRNQPLSNQIDWFDKKKFFFNNPMDLPVSNINAISYYQHYPEKIKSEIYKQYYLSSIPDITTVETIQRDIDLPLSWVNPLDITPEDFQKRYPNSRKTYFFKKTCVEKYAPYSMKDGIVLRVSEFGDYDCKELIYVTHNYEHRYDKLEVREHDIKMNLVYEKYRSGRNDHLKEHIYDFGPSFERTMIYYYKARLDCLSKRHETIHDLTDYFIDRDDFLEYRKAIFDSQPKKLNLTDKDTQRPIMSITERFRRNPSLIANDDIQEVIYAIKDNKFMIIYHRDDNYITPSTRTYIKPSNWNDKAFIFKWNDDFEETYQADEDFKQMSKRDHYHKMLKLIEQENQVIKKVQKAEKETLDLQSRRQKEELSSDLEVSIYDIDRNEKSKIYQKILQQKADEETRKKDIDELDYLAPFLASIGNPERLNAQIAQQLRFTVLRDFKDHSIRKANLMQSHYENEIEALLSKQQWYQKHQLTMSKEDEFEYQNLCQQTQFRLHILEERLKRHKELSTENYLQLESKLNDDIRLKEPYIVR